MDGAGDIVWQKALAGPGDEEALGLHLLPDGDMVLVGTVSEHPGADADALVMRMDKNGNPAWVRVLGGADQDEARDAAHSAEGGLVVAGSTSSFGMGRSDAWFVKLDADGGVLWQRTYGGSEDDRASALSITPGGLIAAAGATESFGAGGSDVWILYLGPDGEAPHGCPAGMGLQSAAMIRDIALEERDTGFLSESTTSFVIETDVVPVDTDAPVQPQCAY
jgi:hypothetical protein